MPRLHPEAGEAGRQPGDDESRLVVAAHAGHRPCLDEAVRLEVGDLLDFEPARLCQLSGGEAHADESGQLVSGAARLRSRLSLPGPRAPTPEVASGAGGAACAGSEALDRASAEPEVIGGPLGSPASPCRPHVRPCPESGVAPLRISAARLRDGARPGTCGHMSRSAAQLRPAERCLADAACGEPCGSPLATAARGMLDTTPPPAACSTPLRPAVEYAKPFAPSGASVSPTPADPLADTASACSAGGATAGCSVSATTSPLARRRGRRAGRPHPSRTAPAAGTSPGPRGAP